MTRTMLLMTALWLLGACEGEANSQCTRGPCAPGNEVCGKPFENAAMFHLMDQRGCGENDPNSPVFDPVHGVIHHFYQDHLAAAPGVGAIYGHFVSKDFVSWAQMPVAIWNGLDSSVWPPKKTPYDDQAIYTGSAVVVDGAGPDGKGPGIVNIYPGLCNKKTMPECKTGTLLAQAIPADYAGDQLLTNWTKPAYNPIMQNTERDPSTPWKMPNGEWRLRTYNSMYGAASDGDLLAGKWYEIGPNKDFRTCECPSFYPLPEPTPGFEAEYEAAAKAGSLPTNVHKTSCGGDWWQLGTYDGGEPRTGGHFHATPGWEDLFKQKRMDAGAFYASKDGVYPSKQGTARRINWGWAQVPPQSAQTLPRVVTFNAAARCLEQAPIQELEALRRPAAYHHEGLALEGNVNLGLPSGTAMQSETVLTFWLPSSSATFGVSFGSTACTVDYAPASDAVAPFYEVTVGCGKVKDTLRLLPQECTLELRVFADNTFLEAFFQKGRVAMTVTTKLASDTQMVLTSSAPVTLPAASVYPMKSIWVTPEDVRRAPRVYPRATAPSARNGADLDIMYA